jgi:hypothetical protein
MVTCLSPGIDVVGHICPPGALVEGCIHIELFLNQTLPWMQSLCGTGYMGSSVSQVSHFSKSSSTLFLGHESLLMSLIFCICLGRTSDFAGERLVTMCVRHIESVCVI